MKLISWKHKNLNKTRELASYNKSYLVIPVIQIETCRLLLSLPPSLPLCLCLSDCLSVSLCLPLSLPLPLAPSLSLSVSLCLSLSVYRFFQFLSEVVLLFPSAAENIICCCNLNVNLWLWIFLSIKRLVLKFYKVLK